MLENYALLQLNNNNNSNLILQLDSAPVHFALIIHDCLNVNFPGRSRGRVTPIAWPTHSDLTPSEFFLLGSVKDRYTVKE
jgi:hypothetical protein